MKIENRHIYHTRGHPQYIKVVGQIQYLGLFSCNENMIVIRDLVLYNNDWIDFYAFGKGFFIFIFSSKEDKDLIFQIGPYFMGPRGLYLNRWTLDFDLEVDIPFVVHVWARLPKLPLLCWDEIA